MQDHLTTEQAESYLRRSLSPADLLAADDHLAGCVECRSALALDSGIRFENIRTELLRANEPTEHRRIPAVGRSMILRWGLAGAAFTILLFSLLAIPRSPAVATINLE